jgi:hypothetical protein
MPQKKITPRCIGSVGELANCLAAILYDGGYGMWIARTLRQRKSRPVSPVMGGP